MHQVARVRKRAPWQLAIVVVAALLGWALVVWHGSDGAATAGELARIRGREPAAAVFRADGAGGWEWHIVGAPPFAQRGLATLRDGHPLLVRSRAPATGGYRRADVARPPPWLARFDGPRMAAWQGSSVVEQGTHKPLVGGSNPPPATNESA